MKSSVKTLLSTRAICSVVLEMRGAARRPAAARAAAARRPRRWRRSAGAEHARTREVEVERREGTATR